MQKGRQIPAWLARRTYFKRIERWAKPGKARKIMPAPEIGPLPAPTRGRCISLCFCIFCGESFGF